MHNRDTVTLKKIIHPSGGLSFFKMSSGNDQRLQGSSGSSVKGFLKTVGNENGFVGKCRNEFEDVSIDVYQRYAILTCNYKCYVDKNVPENYGMYTLQFLKRDQWRVDRVFRYNKTENEYFPSSEIKNDILSCPDINLWFEIPEGWKEISIEDKFIYELGFNKMLVVNDSLKVRSQLLVAIMKKDVNERILVYISKPKFGKERFSNLPEICRDAEINRFQSNIDSGRIKRLNRFTFEKEKQTIKAIGFHVASQQKFFDDGRVVENLSFDALINDHLLLIECVFSDQNSKDEIVSIIEDFKFDN